MTRSFWLLILVGSMWAQRAKPEPYRVGDDGMAEGLKAFLTQKSQCDTKYVSPEQIVEGQAETEVQCSRVYEDMWQAMEEPFKQPDFLWKHVPFKILRAAVGEKEGLSLWLAFPRSDFSTLKSELEKELGMPRKDSARNGDNEIVIWESEISCLYFQRQSGPGDNTSFASFHQKKYSESLLTYVLQNKVDENKKLNERGK